MAKFAANTSVSRSKSLEEIESTLMRYGATGFSYGWQGERAMVQFEAAQRRIRFVVPLPDRNAKEFTQTATGKLRAPQSAQAEWEQSCRQRWRALALVVKAKLEAVAAGISTFESEFLANIVLPNGSTVGDSAIPAIAIAYETGRMVPMLPGPKQKAGERVGEGMSGR